MKEFKMLVKKSLCNYKNDYILIRYYKNRYNENQYDYNISNYKTLEKAIECYYEFYDYHSHICIVHKDKLLKNKNGLLYLE